MSKKSATFYVGRDDYFIVTILSDGSPVSLAAVTGIGIVFNGTEYKSGSYPTAFSWSTETDDVPTGDGTKGQITFYVGKISAIDEAAVDPKTEIVLYDAASPNGIPWDTIHLKGLLIP